LSPQQYALPSIVTPQVCRLPAERLFHVLPPATKAGAVRLAALPLVPSPIWPNELLPQQYAFPLVVIPHV
jgi:hypothetical protein